MKGRDRNDAFFKQSREVDGNAHSSSNLSRLCRAARETGKLILSSKSLTSVPDVVFSIGTSLEEGEKFWEVNPLTRLDLSHNQIASIGTGKFPAIKEDLQHLKLRDNKLTLSGLPVDIFCCDKLWHLDLSMNRLEGIHDDISYLTVLKELLVSENKLTTLPSSLGCCSYIQTLEAQGNCISQIPYDALRLPNLVKLDLSNNKINTLPLSVRGLGLLESLDVSKNALVSLPTLAELRCLTFLNISENRLTDIPELPVNGQLARLYVSSNSIQQLNMSNIAPSACSLTEILLQGNQIAACPEDIFILSNLKLIDLSNNALSNLPHTMGYMDSLQKILLEGNPIRTIRRTLLSTPTAHDLKTYLRTRGPPPQAGISASNSQSYASPAPINDNYTEGGSSSSSSSHSRSGRANYSTSSNYDQKSDNNIINTAHQRALSGADLELSSQVEWRIRDATGAVLDLSNVNMSSQQLSGFVFSAITQSHIFHSLFALNLASNNMTAIPSELMHLPALKRLNVSGNLLGKAAAVKNVQTARRGGQTQRLSDSASDRSTGHEKVDGSSIRIASAFPPTLTALDISANKLSTAEFTDILNTLADQGIELQELLAGVNLITELPASLLKQPKLRELQLSRNQPTELAINVGYSPRAESSRPQPRSLYQYQQAAEAAVQSRPLSSEDRVKVTDFTLFSSLEVLDVSDNRLQNVDVYLPPSLQTLMLANNNVSDVPLHFVSLTKLNTLTLTGNPIRNIRPNIILQGATAVLSVLQNRLPAEALPKSPQDRERSQTQERSQGPVSNQSYHSRSPPEPPATSAMTSKLSQMRIERDQAIAAHPYRPPSSSSAGSTTGIDRMGGTNRADEYALVDTTRGMLGGRPPATTYRHRDMDTVSGTAFATARAHNAGGTIDAPLAGVTASSGSRSVTSSLTRNNSIETLSKELAALEAELERCSDIAKKTQIRKNIALKRSNILRLHAAMES